MKKKFKLSKRILSLALALVMVVGMMPILTLEAKAATDSYDYGFSFSMDYRYCNLCGIAARKCNYLKINSLTVADKQLTVSYEYKLKCCGQLQTDSDKGYFLCTTNYTDQPVYSGNSLKYSRNAGHLVDTWTTSDGEHSGNCALCGNVEERCSGGTATCVAKAKCSVCQQEYGYLSTTHSWGDWTTSDGKHIRTCTLNTTHTESGDCSYSAATCLAASACSVCKHVYAEKLEHNYTYTPKGDVLTEKCTNGCGHSKTATLQLKSGTDLTYTGSAIEPFEMIYPEGWVGEQKQPASADYANNVNAGTDTASCSFTYTDGVTVSNTFTIAPKDMSAANITFTSDLYYNGTEQRPNVYVDGVKVEENNFTVTWKEGEVSKDAGTYTATVTPTAANTNYTGSIDATYTIKPRRITVTLYDYETSTHANLTFTYGEPMELTYICYNELESEPLEFTGALAANYTDASTYGHSVGLGTLALKESENYKISNYSLIANPNNRLIITQATPAAKHFTFTPPEDLTYDGTAKAATVALKDSYTQAGDITVAYYDGETKLTGAPTDAGTYTVKITVTGGKNFTASEGEITDPAWNFTIEKAGIAAPVIASKVYNDTLRTADVADTDDYKVTANAGGIDAGSYDVVLQLKNFDNYKWTDSDEAEKILAFEITKAPLTVTAKDQTITYGESISDEEYTVEGLLNSHDANVSLSASTDQITVSGKIIANAVVMSGSDEVTDNYEITYENGTLVILPDSSALDGLTGENITSDDVEAVEELKAVMEAADFNGADETTKQEWQTIIDQCDELIGALEDAHEAVATEAVKDTQEITEDNAQVADKETLEQAKTDLEQALKDNEGNYTDEEKTVIEAEIERIDDLLDSIECVEAVEAEIAALPETVSPDDLTTVAKIEEAKKSFDALSENEKAMVSEQSEKKLNNLLKAAVDYKIIVGDKGKWTIGSNTGLSFTANGAYSKFDCIEVDGKVVNTKYYDAKSGSTIITLKTSFLSSLKEGKHTITVVYDDGEANGTFTVTENPATGDNSNVGLWAGMFGVSVVALTAMLVLLRRKRREN